MPGIEKITDQESMNISASAVALGKTRGARPVASNFKQKSHLFLLLACLITLPQTAYGKSSERASRSRPRDSPTPNHVLFRLMHHPFSFFLNHSVFGLAPVRRANRSVIRRCQCRLLELSRVEDPQRWRDQAHSPR